MSTKDRDWLGDLSPKAHETIDQFLRGTRTRTALDPDLVTILRWLLPRMRFSAGAHPSHVDSARDLVRYLLSLGAMLADVGERYNKMDEELIRRRADDMSVSRVFGRVATAQNAGLVIVAHDDHVWTPDEEEPGWWLCKASGESMPLAELTKVHGPVTVLTPEQVPAEDRNAVLGEGPFIVGGSPKQTLRISPDVRGVK